MTTMTASAPSPSTSPPRAIARVVIATINRPEGDTGVHTHTRMLSGGLRDAGVACDVVSAFSGSKKWLPLFAVRPLLIHRVNKSWSTLWHRRWHRAALGRGVFLAPSAFEAAFVSLAHTDADIAWTVEQLDQALADALAR